MAYTFTAASSRYLSTSSSPVSGSPMTIACWFNPTSAGAQQSIVSVGVSGASHRNQIYTETGSNFNILANGSGGSAIASKSITGLDGTWIHGAGVYASAASRTPYVNGVAGTTVTTNITSQNTANQILVGARTNTSVGLYFTGSICEVGVWDVALTADEIASLAKGMRCDAIRPQSLKFYAPLVRDLIDQKGGLVITNNNAATVANHPRVYG